MAAGDLKTLTINHPELGSRVFVGKSGEDYTYFKGGRKSNDDDGNMGTDGSRIDQLNVYPWSAEMTLKLNPGDEDFLQDLEDNPLEGSCVAEHISGDVRVGSGKPVGDIQANKQAGTLALKLAGSGKFELL